MKTPQVFWLNNGLDLALKVINFGKIQTVTTYKAGSVVSHEVFPCVC